MSFKPGDRVTHITEHWETPMTVERILGADYTGPAGEDWKGLLETVVTFKEGGFWRASQLRLVATDLFYIQDTRSVVGNSALWWRVDGHGYTSNLDEAWRVTKEQGDLAIGRKTDVLRLCSEIDRLAERHFDVQKLSALKVKT